MSKNNIQFFTILPHSEFFITYFINDSKEPHIKSIKDMEKELVNLLGAKHFSYINDLLYSFQSFLVDVEKKTIIELETTNIKKELVIEKDNPFKNKKRESFLDKFHKLENKNIFP